MKWIDECNINRKKLTKCIIVLVIVIAIFLVYIISCIQIRVKAIDLEGQQFGIIDDELYQRHENVIMINQNGLRNNGLESHGDKLVEFIQNNYSDYCIYYYNAEEKGKITSDSIISGLNALKDMGINKINISLSSKIYSNEIQDWIHANKDITVYASYNNSVNTFDYPAMYDGVIASGENRKNTEFKEIDIVYNSKTILSLNTFKVYKGNSYLSIISMVENKERKNADR